MVKNKRVRFAPCKVLLIEQHYKIPHRISQSLAALKKLVGDFYFGQFVKSVHVTAGSNPALPTVARHRISENLTNTFGQRGLVGWKLFVASLHFFQAVSNGSAFILKLFNDLARVTWYVVQIGLCTLNYYQMMARYTQ